MENSATPNPDANGERDLAMFQLAQQPILRADNQMSLDEAEAQLLRGIFP